MERLEPYEITRKEQWKKLINQKFEQYEDLCQKNYYSTFNF